MMKNQKKSKRYNKNRNRIIDNIFIKFNQIQIIVENKKSIEYNLQHVEEKLLDHFAYSNSVACGDGHVCFYIALKGELLLKTPQEVKDSIYVQTIKILDDPESVVRVKLVNQM